MSVVDLCHFDLIPFVLEEKFSSSSSNQNILDAICHVYVCSIQSLCTNLISRNQTEKKPMNKRCITENNQ